MSGAREGARRRERDRRGTSSTVPCRRQVVASSSSGGTQLGVVVLREARLQGELQSGQRGAQLVGGVGREVPFVAQEFGEAVQHLVVGAGHLADLVLDVSARRCTLHDVEVPLRPKEFDLLALLAQHPGEAVSRETLMAEVWDENWFGSTKTLDVTMAGLRRRLTQAADDRVRLPRITTLRGHGYRLEI